MTGAAREARMITLHQFPPAWGINPSPFCLKAEVFLRLAGIDFATVATLPFLAPRGKLTFITDVDGRRVPDSGRIIDHIRESRGIDLDAGLDDRQRALGHALRRLCEESLYFVILHSRWIDDAGWAAVRPAFFGTLPPGPRQILPGLVRRGIARALKAQGYGRHAPAEIEALGKADLNAIATLITAGGFAVADRPTSVDATLHAFLSSILDAPVGSGLQRHARGIESLLRYQDRMKTCLVPVDQG